MQSSIFILFAKPTAGLLALAVAFFGCRYVASSSTCERVAFQDAVEFKDFVASRGIYSHSGAMSDNAGDNYFIADHPITLDDLEDVMTRRDCGTTPAWRGILWVCAVSNDSTTLLTEHIGGKWRVWGNVLVAGDEELMDRIECLYRNK